MIPTTLYNLYQTWNTIQWATGLTGREKGKIIESYNRRKRILDQRKLEEIEELLVIEEVKLKPKVVSSRRWFEHLSKTKVF